MECTPIYYDPQLYIETNNGNRISKLSSIRGIQNIVPAGKVIIKPGAILRGDLSRIKIGQCTTIETEAILRPAYSKSKGKLKYNEMTIGDFVFIGARSIVVASKIGNCVEIGEDCVIGQRATIKDNCILLPNSIVPPEGVIPPFTVYGGRPAVFIAELPESTEEVHKHKAICRYVRFKRQA